MEDTLRAVAEILGGLAFLWSAYQERRHRKDKKPKPATVHEGGPVKLSPVKRRK